MSFQKVKNSEKKLLFWILKFFKADFSEAEKCVRESSCKDQGHIWITKAVGANYPNFKFIGSVLQDIIRDHLQFTDEVISQAKTSIQNVKTKLQLQSNDTLSDQLYVGVHVR